MKSNECWRRLRRLSVYGGRLILSCRLLPRPHEHMELQCPNCKSVDLKKVSLAYQEGLNRVSTRTRLSSQQNCLVRRLHPSVFSLGAHSRRRFAQKSTQTRLVNREPQLGGLGYK